MPLDVVVTDKEKGAFIISSTGSIDANTSTALEEEVNSVLNKNPKIVVFDMQGVNYISSAGLRVIFKTKKALKRNNGEFYIVNLTPSVRKVFDIVNALPDQEIFASVEELDNYLDKMQRGDS